MGPGARIRSSHITIQIIAFVCFVLFWLRLYVPVNNFSVMSGRSHRFLSITSTFWEEVNVSCSRIQQALKLSHSKIRSISVIPFQNGQSWSEATSPCFQHRTIQNDSSFSEGISTGQMEVQSYINMPIQYIAIFTAVKANNFQVKN